MGQRVSSFWLPDPWWNFLFASAGRLSMRRGKAQVREIPNGSGKRIVERGGSSIAPYTLFAAIMSSIFAGLALLVQSRQTQAWTIACISGFFVLVFISLILTRSRIITYNRDGSLTIVYRLLFMTVGHWDLDPARGKLWVSRVQDRYSVSYKGGGDEADLWLLFIGLSVGTDRDRTIDEAKAIMNELGIPTEEINEDR